MKNKILILIIVIIAGGILTATSYLLFKKDPLALPAPSPEVNFGETAKSYTLKEVIEHKDSKSCWTAIRGKVYDLTPWIKAHPGGSEAILGLCGTDATEPFTKQHEGKENPEKALASFEIGTLKN